MVTEKMIEALKPCPFCGGTPKLVDDRLVFFVRCDSCKPLPTVIYGESYRHLDQINDDVEAQAAIDGVDWEKARQTAIDAWNRRAEAALSAAEPVAAQVVWDEVGTALALLGEEDVSAKARAIIRKALESATGCKAPQYLGGSAAPFNAGEAKC